MLTPAICFTRKHLRYCWMGYGAMWTNNLAWPEREQKRKRYARVILCFHYVEGFWKGFGVLVGFGLRLGFGGSIYPVSFFAAGRCLILR